MATSQAKTPPVPEVSTLISSGVSAVGLLTKVRSDMLFRSSPVTLRTLVSPSVSVMKICWPGWTSPFATAEPPSRLSNIVTVFAQPASSSELARISAKAASKSIGEDSTVSAGCRTTVSTRGVAS